MALDDRAARQEPRRSGGGVASVPARNDVNERLLDASRVVGDVEEELALVAEGRPEAEVPAARRQGGEGVTHELGEDLADLQAVQEGLVDLRGDVDLEGDRPGDELVLVAGHDVVDERADVRTSTPR